MVYLCLILPLRGMPQVQVHFADMSDYAFTIQALHLTTANPIAFHVVITRLVFDPMLE